MVGYFESIYADTELPHRCKTVYIYLRDRAKCIRHLLARN